MFNAFISYSHSADDKFAPPLQNALQKFAKPWYKKRNLEIFRDESSLSASPHLWANITKALDQSEYLILLASPLAENSHWVNEEVKYWLEHKSVDTILLVLTEGEIEWDVNNNRFLNTDNNSLPPALDNVFKDEPFYVDLRQSKTYEDLSLDNPIFKKEILKLAAKLHNKPPNELASEEVTEHRKMIRIRNGAIGALSFLFLIAVVLGIFANYQLKRSQNQLAKNYWEIAKEKRAGQDLTEAILYSGEAVSINRDKYLNQSILIYTQPFFPKFNLKSLMVNEADSLYTDVESPPVALSEDGRRILVPNMDRSVRILDIESGMQIGPDLNYDGRAEEAVFSTDGSRIMIVSKNTEEEYIFRIWNLLTHQELDLDLRTNDWLYSIQFTTDGKHVLIAIQVDDQSSNYSRDIYKCETSSGQCYLANNKIETIELVHGSYPYNPRLSSDGKWVLEIDQEDVAHIFDVASGEQIGGDKRNGKGSFWAFSKDKKWIYSISNNRVGIWDVEKDIQVVEKTIPYRLIHYGIVNPNGTHALIISENDAHLWEMDAGDLKDMKINFAGDFQQIYFSPDGNRLLSVSSITDDKGLHVNDIVKIWDTSNGEQVGHNITIRSFSGFQFANNGSSFVLSNDDDNFKEFTIWDAKNGIKIDHLKNRLNKYGKTHSLDSTGSTWLTINSDNHFRIWNAVNFENKDKNLNIIDEIYNYKFSPDKTILLVQTSKKVYLWDVIKNQQIGREIDSDRLFNAVFSPDGKQILIQKFAQLTEDEKREYKYIAQTYSTISGLQTGKNLILDDWINFAEFGTDGKQLFTITSKSQLWDLTTGIKSGQEIELGSFLYRDEILLSPDRKHVVLKSRDKEKKYTVRILNIANNKQLGYDIISKGSQYTEIDVLFSPNGKQLAVISNLDFQNSARLFDLTDGHQIGKEIKGDRVAFSPNGIYFISQSRENNEIMVQLYHADSGEQYGEPILGWGFSYSSRRSVIQNENVIDSPVFSPDGELLLLSKEDTISVWNIVSKIKAERHIVGKQPVFSPDGRRIITRNEGLDEKGYLSIFSSKNGNQIGEIMQHDGRLNSAIFSPDGKLILTTSAKGGALIWNALNGEPIGEAMAHDGGASNALFSPDGKFVVSTSPSYIPKNVHVWDLSTRSQISPEKRYNDIVRAVFINPESNKILVSVGFSLGKPHIWDLGTDLDIPGELFKLQSQVSTGFRINTETNQVESILSEQWANLKEEYMAKARKHYKSCKFKEYNFWRRSYQQ